MRSSVAESGDASSDHSLGVIGADCAGWLGLVVLRRQMVFRILTGALDPSRSASSAMRASSQTSIERQTWSLKLRPDDILSEDGCSACSYSKDVSWSQLLADGPARPEVPALSPIVVPLTMCSAEFAQLPPRPAPSGTLASTRNGQPATANNRGDIICTPISLKGKLAYRITFRFAHASISHGGDHSNCSGPRRIDDPWRGQRNQKAAACAEIVRMPFEDGFRIDPRKYHNDVRFACCERAG